MTKKFGRSDFSETWNEGVAAEIGRASCRGERNGRADFRASVKTQNEIDHGDAESEICSNSKNQQEGIHGSRSDAFIASVFACLVLLPGRRLGFRLIANFGRIFD